MQSFFMMIYNIRNDVFKKDEGMNLWPHVKTSTHSITLSLSGSGNAPGMGCQSIISRHRTRTFTPSVAKSAIYLSVVFVCERNLENPKETQTDTSKIYRAQDRTDATYI